MQTFEDLLVWQRAHHLTLGIFELTGTFPHSVEAQIVKSQLLRAVTSIAANIAEGHGGYRSNKQFANYLVIAKRSAGESRYWLLLARDLNFIPKERYSLYANELEEIIRMLLGFRRSLGS